MHSPEGRTHGEHQRCGIIPAQHNGLGALANRIFALKGQPICVFFLHPYCALSGLNTSYHPDPARWARLKYHRAFGT